VFQHAAMPLLLDVLEVLTSGSPSRIPLAHVTEPSGELGQPLAIGALTDPLYRHMLGLGKLRTSEHRHGGRTKNGGV
jgi:hypothetical protein